MAQQANKDVIAGRSDELTGISDNFSYVNIDYVPSKSFLPYGQDSDFKILTFNDNNNKISERDMKNKVAEYNTTRGKTDAEIKQTIDNQLKTNIINQLNN